MGSFEQALKSLGAQSNFADPGRDQGEYFREHANRFILSYELLEPYLRNGGKILDVGLYPGYFAFCLKQLGYDVLGIDIEPERIPRFIRETVATKRCDIERDPLPLEDDLCGHVLLFEIIEHLRVNPLHCLREINRVLKKDGLLYVSTPNAFALEHRLGAIAGRQTIESPYRLFRKLETLGHCGHIRLYSGRELVEMLEGCNFEVTSVSYVSPKFRVYHKRDQFGIFEKAAGPWEIVRRQRLLGLMKRSLLYLTYRTLPTLNQVIVTIAKKK